MREIHFADLALSFIAFWKIKKTVRQIKLYSTADNEKPVMVLKMFSPHIFSK